MRKALTLCALAVLMFTCTGANHRTRNFVVEAETPELARQVAAAAEQWRKTLAVEWLGKELPNWAHPCHVAVRAAPNCAPNGRTRLLADGKRTVVWEIRLEGPATRILDSVLPHEMTHAVLATHFPYPLPRWADEGASTLVEHKDQRAEQQQRLAELLLSGTALSVGELFAAGEQSADLGALYVQGYSLTQFLLTQGDKQKFLSFLHEGVTGASWGDAVRIHYGFQSLQELQGQWLQWAMPGL